MKIVQALQKAALRQPDVTEGVACKGTALESATFAARKKTFLFVREADARLKLRESLAEAAALAKKEPTHYQVGASGWVTIRLAAGAAPPRALAERWVEESYRAVAGNPRR